MFLLRVSLYLVNVLYKTAAHGLVVCFPAEFGRIRAFSLLISALEMCS
jgi:hypothetical protein